MLFQFDVWPSFDDSFPNELNKNIKSPVLIKRTIRNILNWLFEYVPMYQMKLHLHVWEVKEYDASEGLDWWLPRLKQKINVWNEQVQNFEKDPSRDYAYYVRVR
jgi:hypothetical protein